MVYDAAIIGAGPAGCAAAIALARSNLNVLLLEASTFPRYRPGESLHPGVEPIFKALGVDAAVNAAGFIRHSGHRVAWATNRSEHMEPFGDDDQGKWRGYQAWRPELDAILLDQAKAQGVTVWHPCRAQAPIFQDGQLAGLDTDRGSVHAHYVIDASGRSQWLRRKLDLHTVKYSPKLLVRYGYVDCLEDSPLFETPLMHRDEVGWTWLARVRPDRCAWVRMRLDGVDPGRDWRPPQLADAIATGAITNATSPSKGEDMTWRISETLATEQWFLSGDAATVLDPASSHGVLRALMSGMQIAHLITATVQQTLSPPRAADLYSQWIREWFHSDVTRLRELYFGSDRQSNQPDHTQFDRKVLVPHG